MKNILKNILKILSLITVCFSAIFLSACDKNEAAIFLDTKKIDPINIEYRQTVPTFVSGRRIYYLLLSKKEITSPVLRLQTIKLDKKYGYAIEQIEIPYAVDFERGENRHAVSDYFVLHQSGRYFARIFGKDNLDKPIAQQEFFIENP